MVAPDVAPDTGDAPAGGTGDQTMDALWTKAQKEHERSDGIKRLSEEWFKSGRALKAATEDLRAKALQVQAGWRDDSYEAALGNHLDKGAAEVVQGMRSSYFAGGSLNTLFLQLNTTYREVERLHGQYKLAMFTKQLAEPYGFDTSDVDNQIKQLVADAKRQIDDLAQVYVQTTKDLEQVGNESKWTGPIDVNGAAPSTSPGGPSPSTGGPPSSPGGEQPGGGPGGERPGGGPPKDDQPGGQQPGRQPGGQPGGGLIGPGQEGADPPGGTGGNGPNVPDPGTGNSGDGGPDVPPDTGLAGGETAAPTLPKIPDSPNTATAPTGTALPANGTFGGGGVGVGTGASKGGGPAGIDQAARNLTKPSAPGAGQAPGLASAANGTPSASSSGAGRPMIPPMMPPGAGAGQGDNNPPRPGTAQAAGTGRSRPAGATPGVPSGLWGRAGTGDGGNRATTASRRVRRDGPQTVELLDSELWEVDQPNPATATDQSSTRKTGTSRPNN